MKKIFSLLILVFVLFSCRKDKDDFNPSYPLQGTTWLLYRYMIPNSAVIFPQSDTLFFDEGLSYKYNQQKNDYSIIITPGSCSLVMEGTPFGNLSSSLPVNFISSGQINGDEFSEIVTGKKYYLWLKKI